MYQSNYIPITQFTNKVRHTVCKANGTDSICCFVTSYEERAPRFTLGTGYPPRSHHKGLSLFESPATSRTGLLPKLSHLGALTKTVNLGALTKTAHPSWGSHQACTSRGALTKHAHLGALTKTAHLGALTKTVTSRGSHQNCTAHLAVFLAHKLPTKQGPRRESPSQE